MTTRTRHRIAGHLRLHGWPLLGIMVGLWLALPEGEAQRVAVGTVGALLAVVLVAAEEVLPCGTV